MSWLCPKCRGSPCILPEETLEGYEAAIDAGVDFVEMDAVRACRRAALFTAPMGDDEF